MLLLFTFLSICNEGLLKEIDMVHHLLTRRKNRLLTPNSNHRIIRLQNIYEITTPQTYYQIFISSCPVLSPTMPDKKRNTNLILTNWNRVGDEISNFLQFFFELFISITNFLFLVSSDLFLLLSFLFQINKQNIIKNQTKPLFVEVDDLIDEINAGVSGNLRRCDSRMISGSFPFSSRNRLISNISCLVCALLSF